MNARVAIAPSISINFSLSCIQQTSGSQAKMQRVLAMRVRLLQRPLAPQSLSQARAFATAKPHYDFDQIVYGQDTGVRTVQFHRPQVLNALNTPMVQHLTKRLHALQKNDTINAIVFSGAGEKAFCAGGDIRSLYDNGKDAATRHVVRLSRLG